MNLHLETDARGAVTLHPARPCVRCGEPIAWAITKNGKRMPLDSAANPAGHAIVTTMITGTPANVEILNDAERALALERDALLFVPHFASCGKRHRKRGGS